MLNKNNFQYYVSISFTRGPFVLMLGWVACWYGYRYGGTLDIAQKEYSDEGLLKSKTNEIIIKEIENGFLFLEKQIQQTFEYWLENPPIKNGDLTLIKIIGDKKRYGSFGFFSKKKSEILKFISENHYVPLDLREALLTYIEEKLDIL